MYEPPTGIPESMQHYLRMWNERNPSNIDGHCRRYRYDRIIQQLANRWLEGPLDGQELIERVDGFYCELEKA